MGSSPAGGAIYGVLRGLMPIRVKLTRSSQARYRYIINMECGDTVAALDLSEAINGNVEN